MCKSDIHAFLHALPKCEQHVHIEGTLMPNLVLTLAARNDIQLPQDDPAFTSEEALLSRYERFTSLDDFLHYYFVAAATLIHAQDFEDLAFAYLEKAHSDGVVHAEIFFDPQLHVSRGIPFTTLITGFTAARLRAEEELGISTELICCFLRHLPVKESLEFYAHADLQTAISSGVITGIGLDSSENGFPPELFTELYEQAKATGLRVTAHAGEEGPAKNVWTSISELGCERIDHGIRLAEDPDMMKEVARRGILLTVCPLSNVRLRCVENVAQLPIRQFLDAGVKFSLNSDDPAYFGGYILDNYCAVQEAFNLSVDEWSGICRAAIDGSWCGEERKANMLQMLREVTAESA